MTETEPRLVPPHGTIATLLDNQVAQLHGFRMNRRMEGEWLRFSSSTTLSHLWLGAEATTGPFWAASDHPGVVTTIADVTRWAAPGLGGWRTPDVIGLKALASEIYQLSRKTPDGIMETYAAAVETQEPMSTEARAIVTRRIGQGLFREALLTHWKGRCPLTGITDEALLRASHIRPWAECATDAERLDIDNGLLLSALWDAAFDKGLVSFDDDGTPLLANTLTEPARRNLGLAQGPGMGSKIVGLNPGHRERLKDHRVKHGFRTRDLEEVTKA